MSLILSDVILNSFILVLNYVPLLKLCVNVIKLLVGIVFTDSKSPISSTSIETDNIITVISIVHNRIKSISCQYFTSDSDNHIISNKM